MQEYAKDIADELRNILDKHKGFIAVSQLASEFSKGLRDKLYIKSSTTAGILMKKIGTVIEENFIIHKKGKSNYILTPCEMDDFVFAQLSENKPVTMNELVKNLKPFTKAEIIALMTEMVNTGKVRVQFAESYRVSFFAWGAGHERRQVQAENTAQEVQSFRPEDYTQAEFRKSYDELHRFREFVRICDLRRSLNWPREAFDGMIRALRDNGTIRVIRADESMLTQDEIRDCFIDENKTLMGLITWNVR